MISRAATALLSVLLLTSLAGAQTTQPAIDPRDPRVEIRANQAFNRGQYSIALPLLKSLADAAKDEPSRAGPIQEKIRVCQKAMDSLKNKPGADPKSSTLPGSKTPDAAMAPETRKKHTAPKPGEVLEMSIKQLGNFEYDDQAGGGVPADVKQLSGCKIRLKGFMIPMDQAENITQFALVPSLFACCFGQPPQLQHTVVVNCPKGKAVAYSPDELIVEGKLTVEEKRDDGYVISLFEISTDSVKVAAN